MIDEAHNLVDRGREMYSASIAREDILKIRRFVKPYSPKLYRALGRGAKQLMELQKECDSSQVLESLGIFPLTLLQVQMCIRGRKRDYDSYAVWNRKRAFF